jgi:DNA-directed RNA polymerase subunit L
MGYLDENWEKLPRYSFKRKIKNNEDYWFIEKIKYNNEWPMFSDEQLDYFLNSDTEDELRDAVKEIIGSYSKIRDNYKKFLEKS